MIPPDYRYPAEYEPHRSTWLLWPVRPDNWRSNGYFAQNDILSLAALIAHFEPVRLGAPPSAVEALQKMAPPAISVVPIDYDDTWVRDTGPTVLVAEGKPSIAIDWKFNSWGGLFSSSAADNRVAAAIAAYEQLSVIEAPIVLEGGSIISDGAGTVIVTEESVLADDRNPGLTRADAEEVFLKFLNVKNVIWLPYGLLHDEAGGHVDNVCAFAPGRTILMSVARDPAHPNYERLQIVKNTLIKATNASRQPFELAEVPIPDQTFIMAHEAQGFSSPAGTIVRTAGAPLAASHINLYATERAIFLPTFDSPSDRTAIEVVQVAFPGKCIVPYSSREFLLGGGAIHCLTREIPA